MDIFNSHLDVILFSIFAVLPGLIWLLLFLKEDIHPEPPGMILRVFLFGALFAIPVVVFFNLTESFLGNIFSCVILTKMFVIIAIAPFLEEISKYFVVRVSVIKDPECDEPVDFMIYAITAALGFATVENLIFLLPVESLFSISELVTGSFIRFIGATLLHAIASGVMGYFLAISVLKKKKIFIFLGLFVAIFMHSTYNAITLINNFNVFIPLILTLAVFLVILLYCFSRLKKMDFC